MQPFPSIAVSGLLLIQSFTEGHTLPLSDVQRRSFNAQTQQELASVICPNSTIYGPSSFNWTYETERYMQNIKPQIQLSVHPGCEDDVAKIVQYANNHNLSFYAVSRGHALTTSVGRFSGIEIDLRNLNSIVINSDNATAHFQGGVYSQEVIHTLWDQGFVTATGTCSCVSVLGPALGGGHGLQQGKHGLTADHIVTLNVVLANGTTLSVNETSHSDLWWAMRGAGHNFGIVTSFESKIWPEYFRQYFVRTYNFGGSSLDALIEQVKKFQGNGTLDPTWFGAFGLYYMNQTLNQNEATISWTFLYNGAQAEAEPLLKPFDQLGPLSVSEVNVTLKDINEQLGGGLNDPLCEPGKTHIIGTAGLEVYNVTAMRAIYDLYNQKIGQQPRLVDTRVLVEGYAVQGVHSFPSDDSAYPFRADNILTRVNPAAISEYFDVKFNRTDDPLVDFATEWRNQTVALWNAGQPERQPSAYVNYAAGYENANSMYGYEPWRLERLRKLKSQYDPMNKFNWYNPFVLLSTGS